MPRGRAAGPSRDLGAHLSGRPSAASRGAARKRGGDGEGPAVARARPASAAWRGAVPGGQTCASRRPLAATSSPAAQVSPGQVSEVGPGAGGPGARPPPSLRGRRNFGAGPWAGAAAGPERGTGRLDPGRRPTQAGPHPRPQQVRCCCPLPSLGPRGSVLTPAGMLLSRAPPCRPQRLRPVGGPRTFANEGQDGGKATLPRSLDNLLSKPTLASRASNPPNEDCPSNTPERNAPITGGGGGQTQAGGVLPAYIQ